MTPLIAFPRSPARDGVLPGGRTGTDGATTTGGRDKRRGTDVRYVIVLLRLSAHSDPIRGAAQTVNTLISRGFDRAAASEASI
ncbi:hypothetical protein [Maricaulis virginensis]|uniref:hypothetical protein n=1 Tax=Maricaulis virginensis TaxID=144022 RepID=UPI0022F28B10|nr:hypothetical protein [Maricaulis virginensis]